ncbi:type IV pilus secretin family protein [Leptolyngbya sp. PCC 6406]|uniref:type IV pilus secretin family protein n=1 Tax=Leptolyngbya sp. PCC 6406 TaxID=1173264 RepID=UPI0002ABAFA9|nr:type IV pilus secretin family protein [Leptolyngbya sp. PCC 6406]
MKRLLRFDNWLVGGALLALVTQPAHGAATAITGVRVAPTNNGVRITLNTQADGTPQVFSISEGKTLRTDLTQMELRLQGRNQFLQNNPAPGIESIALIPVGDDGVRLTVNGQDHVPVSSVTEARNGNIVIDIDTRNRASQASTPVPDQITTVPGPGGTQIAQAAPEPQAQPAPEGPVQTQQQPDVLVPNPQVTIDGTPVAAPQQVQIAPPFLPRAVAPPVGDIAVSEFQPQFGAIDLGTAERVPRLVLRNAPSREVLSLLARAAGLNLVFVGGEGEGASSEGPPVTLDIQNESVQDAFNSVLRITGLQANRVGRTIYVGPDLPISAQDVSVRSLRLNQINVGEAVNFLVALGAESAISRERLVTSVNAVSVGEGTPPITETQTTTEQRVEVQRVDYQDINPIFRGLQVVGEERTNSITLVGSPQLLSLATEQLVRLDLRKRQVAINVRVIDINLNAIDAFGTSFSFSLGNTGFISAGGVGIVNLGGGNTPFPGATRTVPGAAPIPLIGAGAPTAFNVGANFLAQLLGTIRNGNSKILTDPTLIVQEGQSATVALTEDVVTLITETREVVNNVALTTREFEVTPAGLILLVEVDRIDDNGFVSLSVAPSISAPASTFDTGAGTFTLLAERQLSSGQVRVRDGQTLILSGIIQEIDRTDVTKIPILGDLPLLGALFRSTIRDTQRREVIVLLTPQVLDDSDQSVYGYSYTPSEEVQELINRSPQQER